MEIRPKRKPCSTRSSFRWRANSLQWNQKRELLQIWARACVSSLRLRDDEPESLLPAILKWFPFHKPKRDKFKTFSERFCTGGPIIAIEVNCLILAKRHP